MKKSQSYIVIICYLLLSIAAIFLSTYTQTALHWVQEVDKQINDYLSLVFLISPLGIQLRLILSLILTPVIIIAIPALLFHLIKHKTMPYLIQIIWIIWLITVLSRLLSQPGLS